ncbi:dual-domain excinuclease ABC subunit A uvrA [Candidatus Kinetoplastibacterium desouzaii TCC079E]|uniref:UvrABC system protein A n=1 Tax=Candidatus Kinetoplastidibacterium desouzai TCC079E TaxID=1208919 RepID=M1LUY4_9PROT|nr:excinuclease ABC subunit UvrA [Candidatus Kinetoplastibacterium desouzaii]AGF47099.1 dual-domain excinuclease ABC subunit A uvrA [Candidatus Kinetoplastibacterium desouzaii TCC079E]
MISKIKIIGANQNNLKNIDLTINTNEFLVITGVSGSGKSSLAIETLYSEGQNKYLETFSTYARQIISSIDKPSINKIEGILPAILINQKNPIRNRHSTVGTITEINDYLKLVFANCAELYCNNCKSIVKKTTPESIFQDIKYKTKKIDKPRIIIAFDFLTSTSIKEDILKYLASKGYLNIYKEELINKNDENSPILLRIIQDRLILSDDNKNRFLEAVTMALTMGNGFANVQLINDNNIDTNVWKYSNLLYCTNCNIKYSELNTGIFSFTSPLGACDSCSGFGNEIIIDMDKVIPDDNKSILSGAIKPWQTEYFKIYQKELEKNAILNSISLTTPWKDLKDSAKELIINGDCHWPGIKGFFQNLETKSYKMHIRILLSKYRKYVTCSKCNGSRFKNNSLLWHINPNNSNPKNNYDDNLKLDNKKINIKDVLGMPLRELLVLLKKIKDNSIINKNYSPLKEIINRVEFLNNIGLDYLTLDRYSKTLSGGELQRINLTIALGSSLINTLFVIDEPSNGLHDSEINKVIESIKKLRDMGNCVLVIEHNHKMILSSDRIIEMGPKSGSDGGQIIFDGTPLQFISANTITSNHIKQINQKRTIKEFDNNKISIIDGMANNLKKINLEIPINKLISVTGVSGSGKSSLVRDIIYNSLVSNKENPEKKLKNVKGINGAEKIENVFFLDNENPIKSYRSIIASYIGIYDRIRNIFAKNSLSIERNYKPNFFSLNSGQGRCPECNGKGFEKIDMLFIPDVYIKCKECDGRYFRDEILDIKVGDKNNKYSIDQILNLNIQEVIKVFSDSEICNSLKSLIELGLDYLRLGNPIATMSNGEIKRLKLAKYLIELKSKKTFAQNSLIIIDEPTSGLHINEIQLLIESLQNLVNQGNTVIAVEHNLEFISASDWIYDLGPKGGKNGGKIIGYGTPEDIKKNKSSYTGKSLNLYFENPIDFITKEQNNINEEFSLKDHNSIKIFNAYENNLNNIDLEIPLNEFVVITGVSGSGKSTLAFNILFHEGQRRYLMTMNSYARSVTNTIKKADVSKIINLPPTASISQHLNNGNNKSTVGTISEVHNFLRLLYTKLGTQYCYKCNNHIFTTNKNQIVARIFKELKGLNAIFMMPIRVQEKSTLLNIIREQNIPYINIKNNLIATNKINFEEISLEKIIYIPVKEEKIIEHNEFKIHSIVEEIVTDSEGFIKIIEKPINPQKIKEQNILKELFFSTKNSCLNCKINFPPIDSKLFSYNSSQGWCEYCNGSGLIKNLKKEKQYKSSDDYITCNHCLGKKLNKTTLSILWENHNIDDLTSMSIDDLISFFNNIKLNSKELQISNNIIKEILNRLTFMQRVGIGYLNLNRPEISLSGGESQRVHLASQIGSESQGICYILDEPTIGLHPYDNKSLIESILKLKNNGNTVIVVEHDTEIIRNASHIIEIGPGAGSRGGKIVAQGNIEELLRNTNSITAKYLTNIKRIPSEKIKLDKNKILEVKNAKLHNLDNINVHFQMGLLNVVTGLSGSGKSTLVQDVLLKNLKSKEQNNESEWVNCKYIKGFKEINKTLLVDQNPIGKNSRSCPGTFVGFWDEIRNIFASTNESKIKGWTSSRFSFNSKEGQCKECNGLGIKTTEISFMVNSEIICESCNGTRFNTETRTIEFLGKNIGDVLNMEVDEALEIFKNFPKIHRPLKAMQEIGLGYLPIGQRSSNLSGGEAQRIKIVTELSKIKHNFSNNQHNLYILDEPTIGLSSYDVQKLIYVLRQLIQLNNSIIVIEHNIDFILNSDWIIDMGPGGGSKGGSIIFQGLVPDLINSNIQSYTKNAILDFI